MKKKYKQKSSVPILWIDIQQYQFLVYLCYFVVKNVNLFNNKILQNGRSIFHK